VDVTDYPNIAVSDEVGAQRSQSTREVRLLDGLGGLARYGVHNSSLKNLCRGIVERVLCTRVEGELRSPVKPKVGIFGRLRNIRNAVLRNTCSTNVVNIEDYPSLYHDARKRSVYERAVASLFTRGISHRDSYVSTFVKAEKVNFSAKPDPAPRVIQPRSARYNVCVGRYLKPFEHSMYEAFTKTFGYQVICKGLNATTTAASLRENWDHFCEPVAIGLDASRFDQHVSQEALKYEHSYYNSVFRSSELKQLLSWQLVNRGFGRTDQGSVKYTVKGCRMSGDINTSMGNCFIMSSIVLAYFEEHGINARLSNNGDDCVVICEKKHLSMFEGIDKWFLDFGFKLTREAPVYEFEQIEFCQAQPVWTESGYRMVRNPYTASSKDMVSLLSWATELEYDRWRGAISTCGLSLATGVPYWEAFYKRLGGLVHERSLEIVQDSGLGYMSKGVVGCAISPRSRYSFWLAFGITPDMQVALENKEACVEYQVPVPLTFGDVTPFLPYY